MRVMLAALLGLALAACGGPVMGGEDGGGTDDASTIDASTIDAGRDAGPRRDAGMRDAGRDAGARDAGADSGPPPVDAGPPSCTVVPQSGCADGEACRAYYAVDDAGVERRVTRCEPAGPLGEGSCLTGPPRGDCVACRNASGQDLCQAGLYCADGGDDRCMRYCDSDDDCVAHDGTAYTCQYVVPGDPLELGLCAPPR